MCKPTTSPTIKPTRSMTRLAWSSARSAGDRIRLAITCPEDSPPERSGARRRCPGGDHEAQDDQDAVEQLEEAPRHQEPSRPGPVVPVGAVDQDDGVCQQDHGGEEVHHDEIRVELRVHDDPAEDGLGQIPTTRPPLSQTRSRRRGRRKSAARKAPATAIVRTTVTRRIPIR